MAIWFQKSYRPISARHLHPRANQWQRNSNVGGRGQPRKVWIKNLPSEKISEIDLIMREIGNGHPFIYNNESSNPEVLHNKIFIPGQSWTFLLKWISFNNFRELLVFYLKRILEPLLRAIATVSFLARGKSLNCSFLSKGLSGWNRV